jgi:FkbM family methyltransferase
MNVSLICACKNRNKPLQVSLQSWLLFDEIKEIIIVDWSSEESLEHLTKLDSRIKVITVPNKTYFNQPQPLNLAASLATGDSILKFDIDYIINPYWNFFEGYQIDENSFLSGKPNYEHPEQLKDGMIDYKSMSIEEIFKYCELYSPYFKSLIGLLHVKRENFNKCNGYNESLGEFYGFEDEELHTRLEMMGLNNILLSYDNTLIHIPHPDSKRLEHFKGSSSDNQDIQSIKNNLSQYYSGDQLKYQFEYALSQYHIQKNKENFSNPKTWYNTNRTKWNVRKINEQHYIATEMNNLKNFPPVFYVTLEDCIDRQNQIEKDFAKYGIVPNAIKSKRFSESNDIITGKYLYQLSGPTQGCIVSHLKAIKHWYESEESDYAFFCEDDLSLKTVEHWNFTWEEFIEKLPDDCECVQLMTIRGDFDGVYFRERKWDDWSETAYIMNRDYAKKLIDNYCIEDKFHLELKEANIMPIGENILFSSVGKVYTFPLFVEDVGVPTTDINDPELENGQKPNHVYSSEYVYDWWKNNGRNKTISELMNDSSVKKSFHLADEKNYKIVDCFIYFNEKELLELRVNLLKDYVEKFIIADANYTHSGIPKEFTLRKTIEELNLPKEKIEIIEVDLENPGPPDDYDLSYNSSREMGCRERIQRDSILQCVDNFDDNTYFLFGDCDEIINPENIDFLVETVRNNPGYYFKIPLVQLEARADLRAVYTDGNIFEWKNSLFICSKEYMKLTTPNRIRSNYSLPYGVAYPYIGDHQSQDLGWHFSWMGNNKNKIKKSQSISQPNQELDFLKYKNYKNSEMIEFLENYEASDGSLSPSSIKNVILRSYPLEKLPKIIFDLPNVKNYLLPKTSERDVIMKTHLEKLLCDFSLDPEDSEKNFNLGLWYEQEGHTAPALSYFLRSAERSMNDTLTYEALLKCYYCYDRQGTRDGTAISLLQQAICILPKRPEAYFLLARFHERRSQWNDSYQYASLGLSVCDFNLEPLIHDFEYPGQYGLLYEKAISGYWWGKTDESREIFKSLINDYDLAAEYKESVTENLKKFNSEESASADKSSEVVLVEQNSSSFRFNDQFDWGEMTYEHIITIDREIAHENVYGFWKSVKENDVVMDIGASVGPFIYSILDNKPKKVYCVEPSLNLIKTLAKNCAGKLLNYKENPLVYINKAIVSDYEDTVNIFGSILDFEKTTFKQIIEDYSIDKIDFLKIDCEGGEYNIFTDENIDFLLNRVGFVAMEVHLNYDGFREKFKNFRDKYLTRFSNYKVISCTRQNISWGNNVDLKKNIFSNDFVDNYNCEFMIYISNM